MANGTRPDIKLTPAEQTAFLRANRKCALATLDKDGFPHLVAMTYHVADDGIFYMTSYAKAQKVLNIRRNPQVGLMVEAGGAYAELRGVVVRGHCEIVEDPDAVRTVFAALARERPERETQPAARTAVDRAPKRVVLKVTPHKLVTWDHSKLGGRY